MIDSFPLTFSSSGLGSSWLAVGRSYYLKDILQVGSDTAQIIVAITWIPLNIKVDIENDI